MTADPDLERAIEIIIVDAYGNDEQYTAFLTVIGEQTRLPAAATLLGAPVTLTAFDYIDDRGIIARCEGPEGAGEISPADLAFPPETVTAWIHAAYPTLARPPAVPGHSATRLDLARLSPTSSSFWMSM